MTKNSKNHASQLRTKGNKRGHTPGNKELPAVKKKSSVRAESAKPTREIRGHAPENRKKAAASTKSVAVDKGADAVSTSAAAPVVSIPPSSTATPAKPADSGTFKGLTCERITDDTGQQVLLFSMAGRRFTVPMHVRGDAKSALETLNRHFGFHTGHSRARADYQALVDAAPLNKNILGVSRPGYDARGGRSFPQFYALGDGTIIRGPSAPDCIATFKSDPSIRKIGDRKRQLEALAEVARDEAVPLLLIGFALSPIVMWALEGSLYVENCIVDLSGRTSIYKSTLGIRMTSTLWGSIDFGRSWNTTVNGAEQLIVERHDGLLPLDEATAVSPDKAQRGKAIANFAHRLTQGVTRGRMGDEQQRFRGMVISTSNEPLLSILDESRDVSDAISVRVFTISCPYNKSGFFDHVEREADLREKMGRLMSSMTANAGHIAPRLIKKILHWAAEDASSLRTFVSTAMTTFLREAGATSPEDERRAKPVALAYATLMAARRVGMFKEEAFGDLQKPLLRAWRRYGAKQSAYCEEVVVDDFLNDPERVFVIADPRKPLVHDRLFGRIDGIIYRGASGQPMLLVATKMREELRLTSARLKHLKEAGILKADKDLRKKIALRKRRQGKEPYRELFYAFALRDYPGGLPSLSEVSHSSINQHVAASIG